jgi:hypothetical protein
MSRRQLLLATVVTALAAAAPAAGAPTTVQSQTITATGTKLIKVVPKNRKSNASINAAVDAAEKSGIKGAVEDAHEYALDYAAATGLTLGPVISVTDVTNNGGVFVGAYGPSRFQGPFGPNQYCGTEERGTVKVVNKKRVVHVHKVHVCIVPPSESTTLTVTYAAT